MIVCVCVKMKKSVCVCVCVCQRKTKDRADGMKEKSAHCLRRDSNLYLWDTRPPCFRLHHEGRPASRQLNETLQTLTRQLHRETIMHERLQLLSVGPRRQASARTSAESDMCVCVCACVCVSGSAAAIEKKIPYFFHTFPNPKFQFFQTPTAAANTQNISNNVMVIATDRHHKKIFWNAASFA